MTTFQLAEAASGRIRDQHYVIDEAGEDVRATRLEASRTNSYTRSEALDHADWTKSNVSVTADDAADPEGNTGMDKVVESDTAAGSEHKVEQTLPSLTDDTDQTVSFYASPAERTWIAVRTTDQGGTTRTSWIDLSSEAAGTTDSGHTVRVLSDEKANGVARYSVTFDSASGATTPTVEYLLADADGSMAYDGDGSSGLHLWGMQFEADATFPSSYFPTTSSAGMRSADDAVDTIGFNPQELTGYAKVVIRQPSEPRGTVFDLGSNAGTSLTMRVRGSGTTDWEAEFDDGTNTSFARVTFSANIGDVVELRTVLNSDGSATLGVSLNGGTETTSTGGTSSTIPGSWNEDKISLGKRVRDTNQTSFIDLIAFDIASGTHTMDEMRSGMGDLYSYRPGDAITTFSRDSIATFISAVPTAPSRPERAVDRLEIWSDVEAAGGTRLAVFPDQAVEAATERRDLVQHTMEIQARRDLDAWDSVRPERVVRKVDTDGTISEWRIRKPVERHRNADGELLGRLRVESILYDLAANSELVERVEANGDASGVFPLSVTPAEHLNHVLTYAPSYFSAGTVDPTDKITYEYRWDTPLRVLRDVADRAGAELDWTRQADGTYQVDIVDQVGVGAEKTHLRIRKNLLELEHEANSQQQATRLTPVGGGPDVAPADISDNGWDVSSVSGSEVFLSGTPIGFDDQLASMGAYLEKPDGSSTQITADSKANQSVTVADATGLTAGDTVRVVRNAAGDDLTYLEDPTAVSSYGVKADTFERSDIPPVNNLAPNGLMADWTSGMPDGMDKVGAPTVAEENGSAWTQGGGASAHVTAADGEGLETDLIDIDPTEKRPFFSGHARFFLVSGQVRVAVVDVTNGEAWPKKGTKEEGVAAKLGWNQNFGVNAPENFFERSTSQLRLRIVAHGGPAEFYLDAVGVVQAQEAPDAFWEGRASNALWEAANRELLTRSLPSHSYRASIHDLERFDPDGFPHDRLALGADVQVYDPELDADFSTRVVELRRDWVHPEATEIKLSRRPEDMAGLFGSTASRAMLAREPAKASPVPGDVDPGTVQYIFTDQAEVRWNDVVNAEAYLLRWAPAGSGTSWQNANKLPSTPDDHAIIPRETVVNEIGARSFDLLIRARNSEGVESRNAATVLIENPAPDATVIDPSSDWASSREGGATRIEVTVTGSEASHVRLHGSSTSGFSVSESTRIDTEKIEGRSVVGFQFQVPEAIRPVQEGDDAFFKVELFDELTQPLGEANQVSAEATVTVGLDTAEQPPQWGVRLTKQDGQGTVLMETTDLQGRISGTAFDVSPQGGGDWSPAFPPDDTWDVRDTTSPYAKTHGPIDFDEKHPREVAVALRWQDSGGVHHWEIRTVTFDINRIPQGSIQSIAFRQDGTPEITMGWDDDVDHFRFTFNAGTTGSVAEPADPTSTDNRFPSSGTISNGRLVLSGTQVAEDETLWIKLAGVRSDGTIATGKHIIESRRPRGEKTGAGSLVSSFDVFVDDNGNVKISGRKLSKAQQAFVTIGVNTTPPDPTATNDNETIAASTDEWSQVDTDVNASALDLVIAKIQAEDENGSLSGEIEYASVWVPPFTGGDLPRVTGEATLDQFTQRLTDLGHIDGTMEVDDDDGGSNPNAPVGGTVISTNNPSGSYPQNTLWAKV